MTDYEQNIVRHNIELTEQLHKETEELEKEIDIIHQEREKLKKLSAFCN